MKYLFLAVSSFLAIVAQMIATGKISQRGVLAPEVAVPVEPFFEELRKRGMEVRS